MSWFEAIVLGVLQGLTEYLPVSSTAHLLIAGKVTGWGDPSAAFTAVTQLGTMAAVLYQKKVHIGFLAAIVAASNAGGAGSVAGSPSGSPPPTSRTTGGVGSSAVAMLAGLGFHVVASTGRADEQRVAVYCREGVDPGGDRKSVV